MKVGYSHLPENMYERTLYILVAVFVSFFTFKSIQLHAGFHTAAYDLGVFDQNIWLLSRFGSAFNTIRGMHGLGDHFSPIEYLFVPFYVILPSVNWLFLFQALSVGVGAVALFRIGCIILPEQRAASFMLSRLSAQPRRPQPAALGIP